MSLVDYILQRCEELRAQYMQSALRDPVIVGLLRLLPPVGAPFPKREAWIYALSAYLVILYPESEAPQ